MAEDGEIKIKIMIKSEGGGVETPLTVGSRMLEKMLPGDDFTHCILRNCLSAILASPGFFCSQENDRELMERIGELRRTVISAQQPKVRLYCKLDAEEQKGDEIKEDAGQAERARPAYLNWTLQVENDGKGCFWQDGFLMGRRAAIRRQMTEDGGFWKSGGGD